MPPSVVAPRQGDPPSRAFLDAVQAPMLPAASATLAAAWEHGFADPHRLYAEGRTARRLLDQAREVVAAGLGVRPVELSFLPGGPVALQAALDGLLHAGRRRGARVVASAVEHSTVLVPGRRRAAHGREEDFAEVPVDLLGRVDVAAFEAAVGAPHTIAAAIQSANGEVGTRQPLAAVHEVCRSHGVPLVVDTMASLGRDRVPQDYDVLVGDARSFGGPPGVGLLVVPERTRWSRPGAAGGIEHSRTDIEPVVPLVLAAAEAWRQTAAVREQDARSARELVDRIRAEVRSVTDVEVVGDGEDRLPHVVTFSCLYVDGEALVSELDRRGLALASGSACTSSTLEPSHVLAAMGVLTHGNVRVTLPLEAACPGRSAAVERFLQALPDAVASVRARLGAGRL